MKTKDGIEYYNGMKLWLVVDDTGDGPESYHIDEYTTWFDNGILQYLYGTPPKQQYIPLWSMNGVNDFYGKKKHALEECIKLMEQSIQEPLRIINKLKQEYQIETAQRY